MSSIDLKGFPLVSFCLCVFNQEDFIQEALDGAFNQDYPNLEIIISDDSSTDRTWDIITKNVEKHKEKKIILNRNRENLGLAAHINKIYFELSSGEYVTIAAGDDISLTNRVSKTIDFLIKNKDICAVSNNLRLIDASSVEIKGKEYNNVNQNQIFGLDYYTSNNYKHINGASRTVSRSLINAFPPLNIDCPTEDTPFLLRAFMFGKVAQLSDYLVKYRIHNQNLSSAQSIAKMNHEAIFDQYYSDISFAIKKYINEFQFKEIVENLKKKNDSKNLTSLSDKILVKSYLILLKLFFSKNTFNIFIKRKPSLKDFFIQYFNSKKAENKVIKIGGSTWSHNFGDSLNSYLLKELVGENFYESFLFKNDKEELLMIGSILGKMTKNSIIWGAGGIKNNPEISVKPKKVYAVRGPYTREELLKKNIDCPEIYGDPAILLPLFYKPKKIKKFKYGIVPHYIDKYHPFVREFQKRKDVLFIDIEKKYSKWQDFIDLISSCEGILTSSLHGVIISDTYNIPNIWIKLSDGVSGNGFKFKDYYRSVNKNNITQFDLNLTHNINMINDSLKNWQKIQFDRQKLLESFPYKSLIKKLNERDTI